MRSALSTLAALALFSLNIAYAQPAGLVVNEVSQGSTAAREFAELIVVGPPCSTVDIRGWILDDNNGVFLDCVGPNSGALPGTGIAPGHVRFKYDPIWQNVPVGTIILVYAWDPNDPGAQAEIGGLQPDYTDTNCDWVRVVPLNASNTFMEMDVTIPFGANSGCCPNGTNGNPNYTGAAYVPLNNQSFSGATGKLGMRNDGDGFQTREANGNFFHGLSYGTPSTSGCSPQPLFDGGPYGLQFAISGGNLTYQFRNTVNDSYTNVANFGHFTASTTQSPGQPNNCANAQWIGSLRRPPESAFQTSGSGCLSNPGASPQSLCVGQTITLTLPNTNSCTSNSYAWSFSGSGSVTVQGSSNNSTVTVSATSAGTINAVITATVSNSLLYTQGGCTGAQFPQSLTYTFPLNISPAPSAFSTVVSACNQGNGQALFNLTSANNIVNGNTGLPVSWFFNSAGTLPIPNPSAFISGPGTVYAVVTSGPCMSAPVAVTLIVLPLPTAFPATQAGCDQGNGQGAFNLTLLNNAVNGNTGFTVNYWLNANGTNPVPNPSNYLSPTGVVYATVVNANGCSSTPVPITLTVLPTPTISNTFITVSPVSACGSANVTVTFIFPGSAFYNVTLQYGSQTFNGQNLSSGATATFPITQTTSFSLTGVSLAQNGLCSVTFANPPVLTVTIINPPDLVANGNNAICEGESVNLSNIVSDTNNAPGVIPITFHSALPPTAGNQINPLVTPGATTTYYAFANGGTNCQQTLGVTITVISGGTPILEEATLCDGDPPLDLNTLLDPNFPLGLWDGPGVLGDSLYPAGLLGEQILTFFPASCGDPATTIVEVLAGGTPALSADTLCQNEAPLDLGLLQDPNFPDGTWSGPGVTGTAFDPAGLSGTFVLTFTPDGQCLNPATTEIQVDDLVTPILSDATLCGNEGPFDLTNLEDPAYPGGIWAGPGVSGAIFDPTGLTGVITLSYYFAAFCLDTAYTTVAVVPAGTPVLSAAAICESEGVFDLTALQDTLYPVGVWSGLGVSGSEFDPAGQSGAIVLTFTPAGSCASAATTAIDVTPSGQPVLGAATICASTGLFDLTTLQDTNYPDGVWSGNGVSGQSFDPIGLSGLVALTFTPDDICALPAQTDIQVNEFPLIENVVEICNPLDNTYTVSFDISGGDPASYTVNGVASGAAFSSAPVNSGEIYVFEVDDANGCGPAVASGLVTCACTTFSGTMDIGAGPVLVCDGISFNALDYFNNDAVLDADDLQEFALLDDQGNIVLVSNTGLFVYPINVTLFQSYFAVVIVGNDDGAGNVDFNDPCFSMSAGVELIFVGMDMSFGPDGAICANECFDWQISFSGIPPFSFNYNISAAPFSQMETITVYQTDTTLTFCPADFGFSDGTFELQPGDLSDSLCILPGVLFPSTLVDVSPLAFSTLAPTLCPGEELLANGTIYNQANPLGTETIAGGAANGCDSVIAINLSFHPPAEGVFTATLCQGESLVVNGTVYDESNPAGTEIFPGGSVSGCDSTLQINLSFTPLSVFEFGASLCPGESATVNGTVYNMANPSGTELIAGGAASGCDSIINVSLSFFPPSVGSFTGTFCAEDFFVINGTVYNPGNPAGTELFPGGGANGCDSTLNIALSFLPPVVFQLTQTLSAGQSITVNSAVYDEDNPSGVEVFENGSYLGCDSTVIIQLFFQFTFEAVFSVQAPSCFGFQDGQLVIDAISGGKPPYAISLDGIFFEPIGAFPFVWTGLSAGTYQMTVEDSDGNTFTLDIIIPSKIQPVLNAGDDLELQLGESATLTAQANFPIAEILWAPGNFLSCDTCITTTLEQPLDDISYTVTAYDEDGCLVVDILNVKIVKTRTLFAPNIFSPNFDGINDVFLLFGGRDVLLIREFQVFNRWGGRVFQASGFAPNDPAFGWDGRFNGKNMDAGVYVFYAEVEYLDGTVEIVRGGVTLVR